MMYPQQQQQQQLLQQPQQPQQAPIVILSQPAAAPASGAEQVDKEDANMSMMLFLIGFFCCFAWLGNLRYRRSRNSDARIFAKASLWLFAIATVLVVVPIVLYLAFVVFWIVFAISSANHSSRH